ncbi:MAG TPA: signal recognition particle-docking protein FtsY [Polyangiaceae bacterium]|nr:signal recognition particle-docking protein FtsY [Polyangiaceae bacterium]
MLYVVIGLIVLVAIYFLFLRKPEAASPPPSQAESRPAAAPPSVSARAKSEPPRAPSAAPPAAGPAAGETAPSAEARAPSVPAEAAPAEAPRAPSGAPAAKPLFSRRADVESLRRGLSRSRDAEGIFGKLKSLFGGRKEISPDIASSIEEVLLASDVGVKTTATILERVRASLESGAHSDPSRVWDALRSEAMRILDVEGRPRSLELRAKPTVVLFVGVNGAGKTTTIGKLATKLKEEGLTCVLAAGDTFRAAAVQQLLVWGNRVGCEVVKGKDGADPGSVVFEAINKAQAIGADVVLADTAGRLHTKTNLMSEMQKIARTAGKALDGAPHEILLVIDATNGQNALAQAQEFKAALGLTGVVLTKLDGTAKGGVVLGIADELALPVRFVGLGERPDDLHEFSSADFVEALLGKDAEESAA